MLPRPPPRAAKVRRALHPPRAPRSIAYIQKPLNASTDASPDPKVFAPPFPARLRFTGRVRRRAGGQSRRRRRSGLGGVSTGDAASAFRQRHGLFGAYPLGHDVRPRHSHDGPEFLRTAPHRPPPLGLRDADGKTIRQLDRRHQRPRGRQKSRQRRVQRGVAGAVGDQAGGAAGRGNRGGGHFRNQQAPSGTGDLGRPTQRRGQGRPDRARRRAGCGQGRGGPARGQVSRRAAHGLPRQRLHQVDGACRCHPRRDPGAVGRVRRVSGDGAGQRRARRRS